MCPTWWLWKFKLCKLIKLQYSLITTRANTLWPYLWFSQGLLYGRGSNTYSIWRAMQRSKWLELLVWITKSNYILITWFLQWYLELNVDMRLNSVMKYPTSNVVWLVFLTWSQKIDCMDHRFEFHLYSLGSRLYYSWLAILILGAIFVISITWFLQLCLESNVDICPQEAYCHTNFNMDK